MSNTWFGESSPSPSPSSPSSETFPCVRSPGTQDVFHTIVKGRKSWKTLRGGEVVWPPELEAALLEGLESYQPDDSRETRLLGRFPLRNRFISDFIFQKTGKHRSAKQVGSRLQQLRDTCGGKQLMTLLSPARRPGVRPSNYIYRVSSQDSETSDTSSQTSPVSPADLNFPSSEWSEKPLSTTVICIDILPQEDTFRLPPPSSQEGRSDLGSNNISSSLDTVVRLSRYPRQMQSIDPTITLISHSPIQATSTSTVMCNSTVIHTEFSPLELKLVPTDQGPSEVSGSYLYTTKLAPSYWDTICHCPDPTRFTIQQEVIRDDSQIIYSALFKFCYPAGEAADSSSLVSSPPTPFSELSFLGGANEMMQNYVKSGNYYTLDGDWNMNDMMHCSDGGYGSPFDDQDSSRSNSRSPTSACFPCELSNYV
ncbi:hypothetical protein C8J56DRAFT_882983 [Mycena floridula]|nr:hypothetical protein C8J56DRAFT_882983 [Mycena floridula]